MTSLHGKDPICMQKFNNSEKIKMLRYSKYSKKCRRTKKQNITRSNSRVGKRIKKFWLKSNRNTFARKSWI